VAAASLCRLFLNTARRFAYPFAPALSRGLEVPLTAITPIIAVNQITSILSVVFGPVADRYGYRLLFLAGLGVLAVGMFAGGLFPVYGTVLLALFLAGMGKAMFDPSILAYVGEKVPFQRRGTAIGILEMSWAGSSLIGIPLMGLLIARFGWRSPFLALGAAGVVGFLVLAWLFPKNGPRKSPEREDPAGDDPAADRPGMFAAFGRLRKDPLALGALIFAFFFNGANDVFFVVYGAWLEQDFGLGVVALGMATTVIGAAELIGEGMTAALADRFGLRRALMTGAVLSAAVYSLLPLLGGSLIVALSGIFVLFVSVEFTIVVGLSYFTEILPDARATMMAGYFGAASAGRFCGALLGGWAWTLYGIAAIGTATALMSIIGLVCLMGGMRRRGDL
jgi:predicted MFS family arabinose efflux permease